MEARNRMFMRLALRDASIVVGVAVLWAVARGASVGSGPLADLVGLILGLGVGAATFVCSTSGATAWAAWPSARVSRRPRASSRCTCSASIPSETRVANSW